MKQELIDRVNRFVRERDWEQFHEGEHLAKALIIEAAELLELYQWKHEVTDIEKLKDELADVFVYGIMLSEKYQFNIEEIIHHKMSKNEQKYPVDKAYGKNNKYNEL